MKRSKQTIEIFSESVEAVNHFLRDPQNRLTNEFWKVIKRYGTAERINARAEYASSLEFQLGRLKKIHSPYQRDLLWLQQQRDSGLFVSIKNYYRRVAGWEPTVSFLGQKLPVILEISACQYFPWLIKEAQEAIKRQELMPGRFIRVRSMKEQERDQGDLIAFGAAMNIMGATCVQTLDTKGTDGSNIHLGGAETITGYFGGVGQPNRHALEWLDEFLYYYTNYGVSQVLNVNWGTILLAHFLRRIGIKNEFKISVFVGSDNPYNIFVTFLLAKLFEPGSGSSALTGLNLANSIDAESIRFAAETRKGMGLEESVRFEHHITEAYSGIVRQPYNRRQELLKIAKSIKNISAKHEGGEILVEKTRKHPSSILDYFMSKKEIEKKGLMRDLEINYMDKHQSLNLTAQALAKNRIGFLAAQNLHRQN